MSAVSLVAAFSGGALITGALRELIHAAHGVVESIASPMLETAPSLPASWVRYGGARPEVRGWPKDSVLAVRGLAKQSSDVLRTLLDVAEQLGVPVDTVAAVVAHESGWNPAALYFRDKKDDGTPRKVPFVAAGLCQLTVEAHLDGFGDWERVRDVTTWPAERQLREVVLPLWAKYGQRVRGAQPGLGLMLNFLPDKAGGAEGVVLGEKGAAGLKGAIYAMNHGFDADKDGKITISDVYASVARVCRAAKGQRIRLDGSIWTPIASAKTPIAKAGSPALVESIAPKPVATAPKPTAAAPKPPSPASTPAAPKPAAPSTEEKPRVELVSSPEAGPAPGRGLRLGDAAGGLLLAAIRTNAEEAPTWTEVLWQGRGNTEGVRLVLRVSAHSVRAPVEVEGLGKKLLRLPISYREQIEVCRLRKWTPLTQSIADAVWSTAGHRIKPPVLGKWKTPEEQKDSSRRMMTVEWVVKFNEEIDRQIPQEDAQRLWAPEGKDWILHPRVERPDGHGAVNYGLHKADGTPWQPPGGAHDWNHYDYSQTLRALESEGTDPTSGRKVAIIDVLRKAGMPAAVLAPFERFA